MKNSTKLSISLTICSLALCVYSFFSAQKTLEVNAEKLNCTSLGTQQNAQKLYDSDRVRYKLLDRNHDGVACNDLPK